MDANEQNVTVNINSLPLKMISTYDDILDKVAKVVKIFNRSLLLLLLKLKLRLATKIYEGTRWL